MLERRRAVTVLQTVALAIGLMALLLLGMTRNDLVDSWRNATPADAPNRFIINIQPDQRDCAACCPRRASMTCSIRWCAAASRISAHARSAPTALPKAVPATWWSVSSTFPIPTRCPRATRWWPGTG
ncbi:hypothetical protein ACTMU2_09310 [Cupriavidus basilensis]